MKKLLILAFAILLATPQYAQTKQRRHGTTRHTTTWKRHSTTRKWNNTTRKWNNTAQQANTQHQ